jgi:hypothetical protein
MRYLPLAGADFFAGFAGRLLPKEPLKILPFFVFLSPLPILISLNRLIDFCSTYKVTKAPVPEVAELCLP